MSEIESPDGIDWENVRRSAVIYTTGSWFVADMLHRRLGDDGMPPETSQAIIDFMHTACYVDAAIDAPSYTESGRQIVEGYTSFMLSGPDDEMPAYLEHCSDASAGLHRYLQSHDEAGRTAWAGTLSEFVDVTASLQGAITPREYSRNTRLEGLMTSNMIAALLPEEARVDPSNQSVIRWLGRIGQAGNVLDSLVDVGSDIRNGLIVDPQPWMLRAELAKSAMRDIVPAVAGTKPGDWVTLGRILAGTARAIIRRAVSPSYPSHVA